MKPDSSTTIPGTTFGGYRLLSRIAVGGMAEIFLARESGAPADRFLVIKRLLPHVSQHPDLVQMFLDEARVAATLEHPNIPIIYNVGAIGDQYFLSMDHLIGLDLTKVCERLWRQGRNLPMSITVYLLTGVLDALKYAHGRVGRDGQPLQIVHRDVSPHNIFVTFDGGVKLLDFGVAKAANALHHTKTGALVGKVAYMSPEQCRVEKVDQRSDLFSLGIVMYELTTGRRLYNSKKLGEFEVLRQICEDPVVRPSELRRNYPLLLEQVVLRALEKKREDRFQSAEEFSESLRSAARSLDLELKPELLTEFLKSEFPDSLEETESKLEHLRLASGSDEFMSWDSLPLPQGQPMTGRSSSSMEVQVQSGEAHFDAEEQTQPRVRTGSSNRRQVKWRPLPSPSTPPPSGERPAELVGGLVRPHLAVAIAAAVVVALVGAALLLWLR